MNEFDAYFASLDAALIEFVRHDNIAPMARHISMFCISGNAERAMRDPEMRKCALFKAATARRSLPMDVRSKAKKYLIENGFQSWDDGDVP